MYRFVALITLSLTLCVNAYAASVWEVTDGENTMYLGGTLHILSPSDYPLPDAYKAAYEASDSLVFETDLAALTSPEFGRKSMELLTYGESGTLSDDISDKTMKALKAHLEERGIPVDRFMNMRPAMVGITLSMIEFQRMGLTSQGVDRFYYTVGMGDGKPMLWLETPEEQLHFIAKLGEGEEDAYLQYSIDDVEELPELLPELREDWREGDMDGLYSLAMQDFKKEYPDVYHSILTQRNNNWIPELIKMMKTPETEFVLVGTLHMPGEGGILAQLKDQGYTITKK
ncbi:TraB/GumN family protein [Alteromonas halophila]|uniref:Conjugative transfer protein GumN n=1 Tax=Alteromonas halophila TaxID=516698 RepID=A0A918JQ36_9ALTE|nr:TraB/GumN family protein [Alteromonas halophila]GGW94771.1 conjugative transfer protein GumN [Alteromonas halophila]